MYSGEDMILILQQEAMKGVSGVVRYRDEFDEAMQEESRRESF